jgi:hypothetical protein
MSSETAAAADVAAALATLSSAPKPRRLMALKTLHTLLTNLEAHPENDQYHRIQITNKVRCAITSQHAALIICGTERSTHTSC